MSFLFNEGASEVLTNIARWEGKAVWNRHWGYFTSFILQSNSNSLTLLFMYHYHQNGLAPINSNYKIRKPPGFEVRKGGKQSGVPLSALLSQAQGCWDWHAGHGLHMVRTKSEWGPSAPTQPTKGTRVPPGGWGAFFPACSVQSRYLLQPVCPEDSFLQFSQRPTCSSYQGLSRRVRASYIYLLTNKERLNIYFAHHQVQLMGDMFIII